MIEAVGTLLMCAVLIWGSSIVLMGICELGCWIVERVNNDGV